jgi:hypothetical protein
MTPVRSFPEYFTYVCSTQAVMALVTRIIALLILPHLAVGNKNESNKIALQSVAQVVIGIYRQLHSKYVILLHESSKNEGREYRADLSSL